MPRPTVEISQNLQKGFVQHLLFEFGADNFKFALSDNAEGIAEIDPDLSVTAGLISKRTESTGGRGCAPYYERLLSVGLDCMTRNLPNEHDQTIPTKRTNQDLRVLQQIDTILHTALHVPFTDREQADINERTLTMFGIITVLRPDLTARPDFPWKTPLDLALSRPLNSLFGKYNERVNILAKAPEALAGKAMAEYANNGKNILETLYYEKSFMDSGMPEESPELWEVIRRAPDGNLPLAQSTLQWALRVQLHEPISPDVLHRTWQLAQEKWNALSVSDKGIFLNIDILYWFKGMYQHLQKHGKTPPPQIDQILQTMIQTASDAGKGELKKSLIAYIKAYPKAELGIIAQWFPIIAGAVEAHRPKTFFQKAATLFHRS